MSLVFMPPTKMVPPGAHKFPRARQGYEPTAVDEFIWQEAQTKHALVNDNQALQQRLSQALNEIDALKAEVATLYDDSTSPRAVAQRMTRLLQTTADELAAMHAEAQNEAAALVNSSRATAEDALSGARAEAAKFVVAARAEADTIVAEAKAKAAQMLREAEEAAEIATRQQISTLQQLATVHRNLANVPAVLESAYQRQHNPQPQRNRNSAAKVSEPRFRASGQGANGSALVDVSKEPNFSPPGPLLNGSLAPESLPEISPSADWKANWES